MGKYFNDELKRRIGEIEVLATMGIDDAIDEGKYGPEYHLKCKGIVRSVWAGERARPANRYEARLIRDVSFLRSMGSRGFEYSEAVYKEWLRSFEIGYEKACTKGKILEWDEIKRLTARSGTNLVVTNVYFSMPELGEGAIRAIANDFGPIVKEADNLSDVYQDAKEGYIKVPIEHVTGVRHSKGTIRKIDLRSFKADPKYIQDRYRRLDTRFWKADQRLMRTVSNTRVDRKMLAILRFRALSWLLDVKAVHGL
jgi:hypothetical protein